MSVPSIEEAIAALDEELGGSGAQVRAATDLREGRDTRRPERWVNWARVAEWCYAHVGVAFEADPVHANSVYRFRRRFPDIHVEGSNHRLEADGRRVATIRAVYDPEGMGLPDPPKPEPEKPKRPRPRRTYPPASAGPVRIKPGELSGRDA